MSGIYSKLPAVFSGRIFFDHLPKTAGQAVNRWLVNELGQGCVTNNLAGKHHELLKRYGGEYSIVSGHLTFNGEGLAPHYQYITVLREPIDRVISWIYFVLNNHTRQEISDLFSLCEDFIASDGAKLGTILAPYISNTYTCHFASIEEVGPLDNDGTAVRKALSVLKKYDVVGLYEKMPEFLSDVADLIGIPTPVSISRVNVTSSRPKVREIALPLRQRLIELNRLDIQFYRQVVAWKKSSSPKRKRRTITISPWRKYEPIRNRVFTTPEIPEVRAVLREERKVIFGQVLTFEVDFLLNAYVQELEAGIHIFDEDRRWAFGTNSTLQGMTFSNIPVGSHRITHYLINELPTGKYTAGFAFSEKLPEGGHRELAWYDVLCEFEVNRQSNYHFTGYANLPAQISLCSTKLAAPECEITHATGTLLVIKPVLSMVAGTQANIAVEIANSSDQAWVGDSFRPINLSYRWLTGLGDPLPDISSLRSPIPAGGIAPGQKLVTDLLVDAPPNAGTYTLVLTLVQENVRWFEEMGFEPAKLMITVRNAALSGKKRIVPR